jgi:hypothetical protein
MSSPTTGFELKSTRRPMEGSQIPDFLVKQRDKTDSDNSWTVPVVELADKGYDLSARNPNRKDDYEHRPALELVQSHQGQGRANHGSVGGVGNDSGGWGVRWIETRMEEIAEINPKRPHEHFQATRRSPGDVCPHDSCICSIRGNIRSGNSAARQRETWVHILQRRGCHLCEDHAVNAKWGSLQSPTSSTTVSDSDQPSFT